MMFPKIWCEQSPRGSWMLACATSVLESSGDIVASLSSWADSSPLKARTGIEGLSCDILRQPWLPSLFYLGVWDTSPLPALGNWSFGDAPSQCSAFMGQRHLLSQDSPRKLNDSPCILGSKDALVMKGEAGCQGVQHPAPQAWVEGRN